MDGSRHRTLEGIFGGVITASGWTECSAKNEGRSNATTAEGQALLEAEAKRKKKLESGYHERLEDVDLGAGYFEPMLAQRQSKPIVSAPHIRAQLDKFFEENPDAVLDGELYNNEMKSDFDKIISLAKKTKPTQADLEESERLLQYHAYDCYRDEYFSRRFQWLCSSGISYVKSVRLVETVECLSREELDAEKAKYLEQGYEGQIVRVDAEYENKRSNYLLKRKDFLDSEFQLVEVEEGVGNRSGMAGRLTLLLTDGRTFGAGIRGGEAFYKRLLLEADALRGSMVRYQNLTPDGVPRFPVAVAIRDYETLK